MSDKPIHFIAGLPRSGSTLLCNILNQNPRFNATSTSGILEIILAIRNQWDNVAELAASPNKPGREAVIKGILHNYYSIEERPVIFDKSRAWPAYIELAEHILNRKAKIIVPVRNLVDILASFEKLYRASAHEHQFPQEKTNFSEWQTVQGRADVWVNAEQPVGIAYNRIRDAISRGFLDRLHFVEFTDLTTYPEDTLKHLYDFLEEDQFTHDFDNVAQSTSENDDIHGIPGLHTIRSQVKPFKVDAASIIGPEAFQKYSAPGVEFWRPAA